MAHKLALPVWEHPAQAGGVPLRTSMATACRLPTRRPAPPPSPPVLQEGDRVTKGQTICIVEAMKLLNVGLVCFCICMGEGGQQPALSTRVARGDAHFRRPPLHPIPLSSCSSLAHCLPCLCSAGD